MLIHTPITILQEQPLLTGNRNNIANPLFFQEFSELRVTPINLIGSHPTYL